MIWFGIFISGILNFFLKFLPLSFFDVSKINPKIKQLLTFVPSAVFPAIIFPGIFLDNDGNFDLENNPRILSSIIALIVAILSKNILSTIFAGLAVYWLIIFV